MLILGIETSCDETAASVIEANEKGIFILSNIVSSQVKLHAQWGGVVPNLAAREHLKNIIPVTDESLKEADKNPEDLDLIAVTSGPGLIPALLIGVNTAKTLSYVWKKPLMGIHHIEGHIYANFISDEIGVITNDQLPISKQFSISNDQISKTTKSYPPAGEAGKLEAKSSNIKFPVLCLVVSGGHTQLILMKKHLSYEIVGETLDDAAGEAFDKVARILGLGYPGGPAIAKMATEIQNYKSQIPNNFKIQSASRRTKLKILLPRPMIHKRTLDFSFSGLKTAVLYYVKKHQELLKDKDFISEMCYEFQQAVVDVLIAKTLLAAKRHKPKTISLAGGVSANIELRKQLGEAIEKNIPHTIYQIPDTKYSIDNAVMIAAAGYFRYQSLKNKKILLKNWKKIEANANLKLTTTSSS